MQTDCMRFSPFATFLPTRAVDVMTSEVMAVFIMHAGA